MTFCIKKMITALVGMAQLVVPCMERLAVRFLVRLHALVVGLIPGRGVQEVAN